MKNIEISNIVTVQNANNTYTGVVIDVRDREDWKSKEYLVLADEGGEEWREASQIVYVFEEQY